MLSIFYLSDNDIVDFMRNIHLKQGRLDINTVGRDFIQLRKIINQRNAQSVQIIFSMYFFSALFFIMCLLNAYFCAFKNDSGESPWKCFVTSRSAAPMYVAAAQFYILTMEFKKLFNKNQWIKEVLLETT